MPRDTQVRVIVRALKELVERKVKGITLDLTAILQLTTPIDTGWARANWIPAIGVDPKYTAGTRQDAEAGILDLDPQQKGLLDVAANYRLERGNVYVSNNVKYILLLNEGSSKQAPAGFVQAAIFRSVALANL